MTDRHRHESNEALDALVHRALSDASPVQDDAVFTARLRRRMEAEEALTRRIEASPAAPLWRWAVGIATATACVAIGVIAVGRSPTTATRVSPLAESTRAPGAVASQPTPREQLALLVEENAGKPMRVEINETRGSVLFIAAVDQEAAPIPRLDAELVQESGSLVTLTSRDAERSSGWIRTRSVDAAAPRS